MILLLALLFAVSLIASAKRDPEVGMDAPDIIRFFGYPAEEHWVTTPDGYILCLHRIPGSRRPHRTPRGNTKPVVFLQHGLVDSSATWIVNKPDESFGFMLADAGYDVWLGNVRGNVYSTNHTTLTKRDAKFWDFSFDEMAEFDLPTMINYVIKVTNVESLSYFGHSQGSEMGFLELSRNQALSKKVNFFGALAPVARITHVEGFFKALNLFEPELQKLFQILGVHDFAPSNWFMDELAALVCPLDKALICKEVIFLICGWDQTNLNDTRVPVYVSHTPAGTSARNIIHWAQLIKARKLQKFDYGTPDLNMKHYNSTTPPLYDITGLDIPLALVAGGNDFLGDPRDVAWLESQLKPGLVKENLFYDDYNHLDFVWGMDANERVYDLMIALLEKYAV